MTATVARLILAPAVILATLTAYIPVQIIIEKLVRYDDLSLLLADLACGAFLATAWLLVWRGEVRWTGRRIVLTVASVFVAAIPGGVVFGVIAAVERRPNDLGIMLVGAAWAVTWPALTALIWRETADERRQRLARLGIDAIACPTCGYNLTGLREARCPECGSQFTLDQLYAAVKGEKADLDSR